MYSIELTAEHGTPGDISGVIPFKSNPALQLQYGGCGAIIQDTTLRGASDEVHPLPPGARRLVRNSCYPAALSLDERTVFLGQEKMFCAVDIATGAERCRYSITDSMCHRASEAVAMHPSGTLLAISPTATSIVILDTTTLTEWCAPVIADELVDPPRCLEFSHDGTMLAVGGASASVQLFSLDMAERSLLPMRSRSFRAPSAMSNARIFRFAFSADDRLLAAAGEDGVGLQVFHVESGCVAADFSQAHAGCPFPMVHDVKFFTDDCIISCGNDGVLRLHNVALKKEVPLVGTQESIGALQRISVCDDGSILAWSYFFRGVKTLSVTRQ